MNDLQKRLRIIISGAKIQDNEALAKDLEDLYMQLDHYQAETSKALRPAEALEQILIDKASLLIYQACAIDIRQIPILIEEYSDINIAPQNTIVIGSHVFSLPIHKLAVELLVGWARMNTIDPERLLAEKLISLYAF